MTVPTEVCESCEGSLEWFNIRVRDGQGQHHHLCVSCTTSVSKKDLGSFPCTTQIVNALVGIVVVDGRDYVGIKLSGMISTGYLSAKSALEIALMIEGSANEILGLTKKV